MNDDGAVITIAMTRTLTVMDVESDDEVSDDGVRMTARLPTQNMTNEGDGSHVTTTL